MAGAHAVCHHLKSLPPRDCAAGVCLALVLTTGSAHAQDAPAPTLQRGSGKLLLSGGVSSIDGAAGGGLTPWALIGSYATDGEFGGSAFFTRTRTQDYALNAYGVAVGVRVRVEPSLARQEFDAGVVVPGTTLKLDIAGVKVRLAGDADLEAHRWMPQIAVGLQYKHLGPGSAVGGVPDSVDARRNGVDLYLSATKLFLAQGVLVNATLRATKANQKGLLRFGSAQKHGYSYSYSCSCTPEFSVAYLLHRTLAIGAEVRYKPDHEEAHSKEQLVTQFCQASGGPCALAPKDADMKKAHEGVDITRTDFNVLVEVLQRSMDAQGIAFTTQNRLLAKLAPTHRGSVNAK